MTTTIKITAPFSYVKVADPFGGGVTLRGFYDGAVVDATDESAEHLIDIGHAVEVDAAAAAKQGQSTPEPSTIEEILDAVGDDASEAAAYLALEQGKDKPRKSLVDKLEAIIAASEGEQD